MIKLKPPTHTIDGLAVYISATDPAWDFERLTAEREALNARALAEKQGCTSDECAAADTGDETAESSDAVGAMGRLGWVVMGAVAVTGVAVGVTLALRSERG